MDDDVEKHVGMECFSIRVCDYLGGGVAIISWTWLF